MDETKRQSSYSLTIALTCETNTTFDNTTSEFNTSSIQCEAYGKLFVAANMTLYFKADVESVIITAIGDDFKALCDQSEALSASVVNEINIFGLKDILNNYDHHRNVRTNLDLCQLETEKEILVLYLV